ncbi:MAG: hypothetical protein FWH11_02195 [Micrococcales bacterium]|nr:hypothetical protein [Micrococcales bacterium]
MPTSYIRLGAFGRPGDGSELVRRIDDALRDAATADRGLTVALDGSAQMDGADITWLDLDLTGTIFDVDMDADGAMDPAEAVGSLQVVARESGWLGQFTVRAHPLTVGGVPVEIDLELDDIAFDWATAVPGTVGIEVPDASGAHGFVRLSASREALVEAVGGAVRSALAPHRLRLVSYRLVLDQTCDGDVLIDGFLRIGKSLVTASARLRATVRVDDDVRLASLSITSANPLVAVFLLSQRRRISEIWCTPVPLTDILPAGIQVAEPQVVVQDAITVSARLGSPGRVE